MTRQFPLSSCSPRIACVAALAVTTLTAVAMPACGGTSLTGRPGDGGPEPVETQFMLSFEALGLGEDAPFGISDFAFLPGGDELVLTVHGGSVEHYRLSGGTLTRLGVASFPVAQGRECGLIGITPDPDFTSNRFLYLSHCVTEHIARLSRVRLEEDSSIDVAEAVTILENQFDEASWLHNIGSAGFEADGAMWVLSGDKGDPEAAQDATSRLGALLRIVPSREAGVGGFTAAAGNPFDDDASVYAIGIRSPWRGAASRLGYWIADVGLDGREEVNLVRAPGDNLGWPLWEGPCRRNCEGLVDPVVSYGHDGSDPYLRDDPDAAPTEQRSVFVSAEYPIAAGDGDPYGDRLDGRVFFGDFAIGFVRTLLVDEDGAVREDRHAGHLQAASSFRIGPDGYYYVAQFGGFTAPAQAPGALYRLRLIEP